jgi:hypothetical protein
MATGGQFYWPPAGISVAAYGQFFMAANMALGIRRRPDHPIPLSSIRKARNLELGTSIGPRPPTMETAVGNA